ncbi:MAG: hypothetical protein FWD61_02215 [Phycisphaerales bacterium]|nr:hypothetical protein [Phycisphaerales bacterium]
MKKMIGILASVVLVGGILFGEGMTVRGAEEVIDWNKARQLRQREQNRETLSAEEQAYLDRAKAAIQSGNGPGQQGQRPQQGMPEMTPRESTGLVPLTDLKEKYKGQDGGLYGGGSNEVPAEQMKRAMEAAGRIRPLDKDGNPAADGKIVLMSIGMSNTTQAFSRFKVEADADKEKNPQVVIVDGAQGGMDAAAWVEGRGDIRPEKVWANAEAKMTASGVTPQQVQVIWIKQAVAGTGRFGEFPKSSDVLKENLVKTLQMAKEKYPNLQVAYLSSRIYAGYATTGLNPEPYAYEGAFAVRGVIEMQMKGDAGLNCDASKGAVKAPVVLWGPYLWADGVKGRKGDDLVWQKDDLANDGTHPSQSGQKKVAQMLLKFMKTDATAKGWFVK